MFNPNPAFLLVQKLKLAPRAFFTVVVKAEIGKKAFQSAPSTNNAELYGLVSAPRLKKRIP
jgi:hypothetical protein